MKDKSTFKDFCMINFCIRKMEGREQVLSWKQKWVLYLLDKVSAYKANFKVHCFKWPDLFVVVVVLFFVFWAWPLKTLWPAATIYQTSHPASHGPNIYMPCENFPPFQMSHSCRIYATVKVMPVPDQEANHSRLPWTIWNNPILHTLD